MSNSTLWKYSTPQQCKELILSFQLFGNTNWPKEKQIACLYAVSNHIEAHYYPVIIPKKDGTLRHLSVPDPLLNTIQKNILHHIIEQMPVSKAATAYQKGSDILTNAAPHKAAKQLLQLDLKDYYNNILFPMVIQRVFKPTLFPPSVSILLTQLCCYKEHLPQGAPTSPAISNLILKPFDNHLTHWCQERGIIYTRYCDDLTFSGDFKVPPLKSKVTNYIKAIGFTPNPQKTRLSTQSTRQTVTGITVNQKLQVSKDYRRKLRQEIHYCTKYGITSHLKQINHPCLSLGKEAPQRYQQALLGKLNHILHINPQDPYFQKQLPKIKALYP